MKPSSLLLIFIIQSCYSAVVYINRNCPDPIGNGGVILTSQFNNWGVNLHPARPNNNPLNCPPPEKNTVGNNPIDSAGVECDNPGHGNHNNQYYYNAVANQVKCPPGEIGVESASLGASNPPRCQYKIDCAINAAKSKWKLSTGSKFFSLKRFTNSGKNGHQQLIEAQSEYDNAYDDGEFDQSYTDKQNEMGMVHNNFHHDGARSNGYYHEYGAYDNNNHTWDYALLFGMGTLIIIGVGCLVAIISIICGFGCGKFYEMRKGMTRSSKRDHHVYHMENVSEDQV